MHEYTEYTTKSITRHQRQRQKLGEAGVPKIKSGSKKHDTHWRKGFNQLQCSKWECLSCSVSPLMKRKRFTVEHYGYYVVTFNGAKDSSGEGTMQQRACCVLHSAWKTKTSFPLSLSVSISRCQQMLSVYVSISFLSFILSLIL